MSLKDEFNQLLGEAGIDSARLHEALVAAGYHVHHSTVGGYINLDNPAKAKEPPPWMMAVARHLADRLARQPTATSKQLGSLVSDERRVSRVVTVSLPLELARKINEAREREGSPSRNSFVLKLIERGFSALYEEGSLSVDTGSTSDTGAIPDAGESGGLSLRYSCAICGQPVERRKGDAEMFLPPRHAKANGKPCPGAYRYAQIVEASSSDT